MNNTAIFSKERLSVSPPPLSIADEKDYVATAVSGHITISVHRNLDEVEAVWRTFEKTGICSLYQRFDWVSNWIKMAGNAQGAEPYIVIGWSKDRPLFLYPLALYCIGPFCVVNWMGCSHSNFNMGIYEAGFMKNVRLNDMRAIFDHIVSNSEGIDAFELCCQPVSWRGNNNPMNFLKHTASANHAFSMQLAPTFDEVLTNHNAKKKRKKFRWQMRALEPLGGPVLIRADSEQQIDRLLDASFEQIKVRLSRMGVSNMFEKPGIRPFFRQMAVSSLDQKEPALAIYGLEVDGKIRATFAGGGHQGRFSGCFTSIAMDELSNTSPGDLLLHLVIEDCTKRGYDSFDLGRGEERYKSSWCNEVVPMFESFIPVSRKAVVLTLYDHAKVTVKRLIKQNPKTWQLAKKVRAKLK